MKTLVMILTLFLFPKFLNSADYKIVDIMPICDENLGTFTTTNNGKSITIGYITDLYYEVSITSSISGQVYTYPYRRQFKLSIPLNKLPTKVNLYALILDDAKKSTMRDYADNFFKGVAKRTFVYEKKLKTIDGYSGYGINP